MAYSGHGAHQDGLRALRAGEHRDAIEHLSRSARWYLPGSSRVGEALQTMMELGAEAETRGDTEQALSAYREVRRCIRSIASLWTPYATLQPQADTRIAHLMAGQSDRNRAGEVVPFEARKAEHLALLVRDDRPDPFWSLAVVLCFLGWVGAAFAFIQKAWDDDGGFHPGPALRWAGVVVTLMALWMLALRAA